MVNNWQQEYKEMMEHAYFTNEEKEHMAEKLMQSAADRKINGESAAVKEHKTTRKMKGAVAAACLTGAVLLTGATGTSAAGLLKSVPDVFEKVFRLTGSGKELADEIGTAQSGTAISKGIRVTADAVLADSYACAAVFSVERKDGKPLGDGEVMSPDMWDFAASDTEDGVHAETAFWGTCYSYDEDPEDAAIQYVMLFSSVQEMQTVETLSVHLSELYHLNKEGERDYVVNGDWYLDLSMPKAQDKIITAGDGQTFHLDGNEFTIDRISLSPLSYHFTFSMEKDSGLDIEDAADLLENCDIDLELKNGEKIRLGECGNGVTRNGSRVQFVFGDIFQPLLQPEEMKTIHIGGLEIPVSL